MSTATENSAALAIVRLGYALDDPTDEHRCLNFRAGFETHEGAFEAIKAIGSYNLFDGEAVAAAIENVGLDPYSRISVGREGSVVVYVRIWGGKDEAKLIAALRHVHADEVDVSNGELRAWWD